MYTGKLKTALLGLVILTLCFAKGASGTSLLPSPRNMVNDSAHLYTPEETERLETLLRNYRDSTRRDILVVTVNDFQGYEVNDFATRLGNDWGVGQRGVDNGVIFLLRASQMPPYELPTEAQSESTIWQNNSDGSERIKNLPTFLEKIQAVANTDWKEARPAGDYGEGYIATGRGIEGALPDVLASRIMRNIVAPYVVSHHYAAGTEAGVYAIIATLAGDQASISSLETADQKGTPFWLKVVGAIILILLIRKIKGGAIGGLSSGGGRSTFSGGSSRGSYSGGGGSFGGGGGGSRF